MKTSVKNLYKTLICAAITVVLGTCVFAFVSSSKYAVADIDIGKTFYRSELEKSELAQRFYDVMQEMADSGKFKYGKSEYDLTTVLSQAEINDYLINSSPKIPVAFGAARDAFYMDHPELFYADVCKLYFSAGTQGDRLVAFIGTGNADNYYADNTFSSAAEVGSAISAFESKLGEAVAAAKANGDDVVSQIKNANAYIIDNVNYDYSYGATKTDSGVVYDGHVYTAYGALVNGKAVCSGFAGAFKAIMDRLGIPCVLISGSGYTANTASGMEAGYEAHMWNAVWIDGLWYGVDTTWNKTAENGQKYLLVGDEFLSQTHIEDNVISSSGFELKYPKLRSLGYGIDEDANGFVFEGSGKIGDTQFGYKEATGSDSGKVHAAARLAFEMKKVVCPKVFNDGRMFMKVFGEPQFVSSVDESVNEFKDKTGQPIVGDQRSQLMLVVNEPTQAENQTMTDKLVSDSALEKSDILSSSTYQISLHMCGMLQKLPQGSYMQVGFGFPDGYKFGAPGVTYTVYHYKRNDSGEIIGVEPVPCVITEYGIVATVNDFSPFMVCAIPDAKAPQGKTIYAAVNGAGGKLDGSGVAQVLGDGNVTYTLTADDGYVLDKITLNGDDIKSKLSGNTVMLDYADLDENNRYGNVLEVSFVSERVKSSYNSRDIKIVSPKLIVTDSDMIESVLPEISLAPPGKNSNAGLIAGIVVLIVIILIGGGIAAYLIVRKKKNDGNGKPNANGTGVAVGRTSAATKTATRTESVAKKPATSAHASTKATEKTSAARTAAKSVAASTNAHSASHSSATHASPSRPASSSAMRTSATAHSSTAARKQQAAHPTARSAHPAPSRTAPHGHKPTATRPAHRSGTDKTKNKATNRIVNRNTRYGKKNEPQ